MGLSESDSIYLSYVAASDGDVTGFVQISQLDDAGLSIESQSDSLAGTINGDQIVVTAFGQSWTGVLSDGSLALTFPRADGTVGQMRLEKGSVDDYNAAVARLQQSAQAATDVYVASSIADAEATAAMAQLTKLFSDVRTATSTLENLTSSLPTAQTYVDEAVGYVQLAADEARSRFGSCDEVPYSLDSVVYAVESVTYSIDSVDWTIDDVRRQQANVSALAAQLEPIADSDDTAFAVYAAEEAVLAADTAVQSAISLYEASFESANQILVGVGSEAAAACPSLTPPGPVTTQP